MQRAKNLTSFEGQRNTAVDGWMHDAYSSKIMLIGETVLGLSFVAISLSAFAKLNLTDKAIIGNYKSGKPSKETKDN